MTIEAHALGAIVQPGTTLEEIQQCLNVLIEHHRSINWRIGDLVNAAQKIGGDQWDRQLPLYVHPNMLSRYSAVSSAYALDERNIDANWTIHMNQSKNTDRIARVKAIADAGQTSDEARRDPAPIPEAADAEPDEDRWLLCIDISYYVNKLFSNAHDDTAVQVTRWLQRVITILKDDKGLTDVVVCFDAPTNHRKEITQGWEVGYKSKRSDKDPELLVQLAAMPDRLREINLPYVIIDGMEADDVMATYAKKFKGAVSLLTPDKDLLQCLVSGRVNMLKNVPWEQNTETGQWLRTFEWMNEERHFKEGIPYGCQVNGITPAQWPHFQALAGDSTDSITGCVGIGGKIAMGLIHAYGTVQKVIAACKTGDAKKVKSMTEKKMDIVLNWEPYAEKTLLLTTMRTDLDVPMVTKLAMKAPK